MSQSDLEHDFLRFRARHDPAALARVFDATAPKLLLLAAHLARDAAAAEDLVQATFLAALRDAKGYDARRPLLQWLAGILAHRAADLRRREGVRATRPLAEAENLAAGDDPSSAAAERELVERVAGAIDALAEPYREVLVLRTAHGLTPTEIAHALGRAPGTVRMQLARAREQLEERLPRSLALPALFLGEEGGGLRAVREHVLSSARALGAPALGVSGVTLAALLAVAVVGVGWFATRTTSAERAPALDEGAAFASVSAQEPAAQPLEPTPAALAQRTPRTAPATAPAPARAENGATRAVLATVQGRVLDLAGQPVAGATVFGLDEPAHSLYGELARTDENGTFRAAGLAPGLLLGARKDGFQPSSFARRITAVKPPAAEPQVVILRLGADGQRVSGRVTAPAGGPLPGLELVFAVDEDARKQREGMRERRTSPRGVDSESIRVSGNADGSFASTEIPAGMALVVARPGDPASPLVGWRLFDVRAEADNRCELALVVGGEVDGRITTTDGRPFDGLCVRSEWRGSAELGKLEDAMGPSVVDRLDWTDEDGRYALRALLPGEHELTWRRGARTLGRVRLEVAAGETRVHDASFEAQAECTVRVLGPDGAPLAGWGLSWSSGDEERDFQLQRDVRMPVTLDGEGSYRIEALDERAHELRVHAPADERGSFSKLACGVRPGIEPGPEEVVLRLVPSEIPGAVLTGTWLDAGGRALAGAQLHLERDGAFVVASRTDEGGRFRLERLPAGELSLVGDALERYPQRGVLARLTLTPDEVRELGTLSLPEAVELTVELVSDDGLPITEPRVHVVLGDNGYELSAEPGAPFHESRLWPGGYVLSVRGADIAPLTVPLQLGPEPAKVLRVVCPRGVELELECALLHEGELERPEFAGGGRLDVTVFDAPGIELFSGRDWKPYADARARLVRFPLRLAPGEYRVVVVDHSWKHASAGELPTAECTVRVPASGAPEPVRLELR